MNAYVDGKPPTSVPSVQIPTGDVHAAGVTVTAVKVPLYEWQPPAAACAVPASASAARAMILPKHVPSSL